MNDHTENDAVNTSPDRQTKRDLRRKRRRPRSSSTSGTLSTESYTQVNKTVSPIPELDILNAEVFLGSNVKSHDVTPGVLRDVLAAHIDGSWAAKIERIRQESDDAKRKILKRNILPYYILATFNQNKDGKYTRSKETFKSTEYMQFDFDEIEGGIDAVEPAKQKLLEIPEAFCVFLSPSGRLRCIINLSEPITDADVYTAIYKKIAAKVEQKTGLKYDRNPVDAARPWYFSHDPDMVIREAPLWDIKQYLKAEKRISEKRVKRTVKALVLPKISSKEQIPDTLIDALLELKYVQLGYHDWNNVLGLALAALLAEAGRDLWIEISTNEFYNDSEDYLDEAYDKLLAVADPDKSSPKVLEKLLRKHEVDFQPMERDDGSFWSLVEDPEGKTKVLVSIYEFSRFTLKKLGFFYDENTEEIGRIVNGNLVQLGVTISELKNTIVEFVQSFKLDYESTVMEFLVRRTSMFSSNTLEFIPTLSLKWHRDDEKFKYLRHKAGITRISKKDFRLDQIGYDEIGDYYVNVNQILDWDGVVSSKEDALACDYAQFINRINDDDPVRIDHMYRAFGFLLDNYKRKGQAYAVVLVDKHAGDSFTPMGGGGKGLALQGVTFMLGSFTILDGKLFKSNFQFQYQNVRPTDILVIIDDVSYRVKSGDFFHQITGDFKIEKKGIQAIIIPFDHSPRLAFTCNTLFVDQGSSNARRYVTCEVGNHYNLDNTPLDEFGRELFSPEWNPKDWQDTISFMILMITTFLEKGLSLRLDSSSLKRKRIVKETSEDWMLWAEEFLSPTVQRVNVNDLRGRCMTECGKATYRSLENNRNLFSTWLRRYVEGYKGWSLHRHQSSGASLITIVELDESGTPIPSTNEPAHDFSKPRSAKGYTNEYNGSDDALTEFDDE